MEDLSAKAFDSSHPGAKPRQTLLNYALWHGQHHWVERLAAAGFQQARGMLVDEAFMEVGFVGHAGLDMPQAVSISQQNLRALGGLRQHHLQASAARNIKDVLRLCDLHGVDHPTPVGATPLMLAARAGNAVLVDALLGRGADARLTDDFGQTAWQQAVDRALEEPAFASSALPALFDRLAPAALDVQTEGRLVRLERHQSEYWVLTLMLAGLKTQWSSCAMRGQGLARYSNGFFADQLHRVLEALPPHLWTDARRKRTYVNQVLARGEVASSYEPARRLWARSAHGCYLPNPAMQLRLGRGWVPVYEALNLRWIDAGTGGTRLRTGPSAALARLGHEVAVAAETAS